MFAVMVAGRLPQVDFQNIEINKYLITIPDADSINFLIVFMTGTVAFPPGLGGSVYFSWPDPNAPQSWQYLGFISNEKPSAVFKVQNLKAKSSPVSTPAPGFGFNQTTVSHVAQIGISVDSLEEIKNMTPANLPITNDHMATFATKTAENLFNFVSSFSSNIPGTSEQVVPLTVVQNWYQNYLRKIEMNPNFWKN